MVSSAHLWAFVLTSFALIAVPGPSVLFVVTRALVLGRRGALITVVGNSLGVYVQVMAVAFGIGAIVERSVAVFTVIKLLGAAYLIYLGIQAIRHRRSLSALFDAAPGPSSPGYCGRVSSSASPTPSRWCSSPPSCPSSWIAVPATSRSSCSPWVRCS